MEKIAENKENITRACLQLNDKIYPVYEGHNTIGRNPDAVINIKNLNVSKIHAVVTVLEQDAHYLSDFKSSNGTFLDGSRLAPLQVYKLSDGASVKFGDVLGTYKKIDDGKLARKSFAESQLCSESFYGASTQEVCLGNLPEGINFNEMPTQIFAPKDLSFNEMPTQMHNFDDLDDSSDESVDLMTMQKTSESQMITNYKNILINSENGPTASTVPATANSKNSAESDTDDGIPGDAATQESVIRTRARNLQRIAESDNSETDDDLAPSAEIKPVKIGKRAIESESDTDDYDYKDCKMDSKYDISDSETDVDEKDLEDLNASQMSPKCEEKENNSISETVDGAVDDKIEESGGTVRLSKKVLPQDHLYCQAVSQTQEQFEKDEERLSLERKSEDEIESNNEDLPETRIGETGNQRKEESQDVTRQDKEENEETVEVPDAAEAENLDQNIEEVANSAEESDQIPPGKDSQETCSLPILQKDGDNEDDIFDEATQALDFDFADYDKKQPDEEVPHPVEATAGHQSEEQQQPQKKSSLEDDNLNDPKMSEEDKLMGTLDIGNALHSGDGIRKEYDVYLQPTQTLDILKDTEDAASPNFFEDDDDEIFLQPTQILEKSLSASSDLQLMKQAPKEENDEIFLHPTQALENLHGEEPMLKPIVEEDEADTQELEAILADEETKKIAEEEILPPTQALELLHGEDQISEMEKSLTEKSDNEDLFLPPTQALETLLSEDLVEKDVFRLPKPSPAKKSPRRKLPRVKSPVEEDDSFILQPTQALEMLHDDGTPFNKVEDQLHDIFASQSMLCTQQLVDVLDTSKDEVIEDSMLLERSRKTESMTEEAVKDILEDGGDEDVGLVVNRLSGNRGVKTYSKKTNEAGEASTSKRKAVGKRKKSVDGARTMRRGSRRRQDSVSSSSDKNEEDTNEDDPVEDVKDKKKGIGECEKKNEEDTSDNNTVEDAKEKQRGRGKSEKKNEEDTSDNNTVEGAKEKKKGRGKSEKKNEEDTNGDPIEDVKGKKKGRGKREKQNEEDANGDNTIEDVKETKKGRIESDKPEAAAAAGEAESGNKRKRLRKLKVDEEAKKAQGSKMESDKDSQSSTNSSVSDKKEKESKIEEKESQNSSSSEKSTKSRRKQNLKASDESSVEGTKTIRKSVRGKSNDKGDSISVTSQERSEGQRMKWHTLEVIEESRSSVELNDGDGNSGKSIQQTVEPARTRTRGAPLAQPDELPQAGSSSNDDGRRNSKTNKKPKEKEESVSTRRTRGAPQVKPDGLDEELGAGNDDQLNTKTSKKEQKENEEPVMTRRTRGTLELQPEESEQSGGQKVDGQGKSKTGKKLGNVGAAKRRTKATPEVQPKESEQSSDNELSGSNDDRGNAKSGKKREENEEPVMARRTRGSLELQPEESEQKVDSQGKGKTSKKHNVGSVAAAKRRTRATSEVQPKESEPSSDDNDGKISKKQMVGNEEPLRRRTRATPEVQPKESEQSGDSQASAKKQDAETEEPARKRRTRATPETSEEQADRPKRKKAATDEPPETPKKKNSLAAAERKSPKKRGLKLPSDSEDEFEAKVQKVERTPPKSKRAKEEDGVSASSSSTQQTTASMSSAEAARTTRRLSANSRRQKREEEERRTGVVATPERSKRTVKPKVVFTMMDNPELESLIRQLGGSVVDSVESCTVLVTESVKRSQKLLCAVAQGKPVCSPQWLQACKKAYAFVDPWDYLLVDKPAEKKWNFSLRDSITRAAGGKLLQDHTFQIMMGKGNDSEKVLKGAIEACGGKCVTKNLASSGSEHLIVVASENQKVGYSRLAKQNPNIKVVQAEAIFDGTLRQEFRFDEFLMS